MLKIRRVVYQLRFLKELKKAMPPPRSQLIMGVLNLTPDSFSDGGEYFQIDAALARVLDLLEQGADLVDVGAESTRPGATPLTSEQEWQRLNPLLSSLSQRDLLEKISLDTRHGQNMLQAHARGVKLFNNISGLADEQVLKVLAKDAETHYIAMHMQGKDPKSMQENPLGGEEAVSSVTQAFEHYERTLKACGFSSDRIFMDPGIGFGKDDQANFRLLAATKFLSKKYSLVIGVSRKSFLGRTFGIEEPKSRDAVSKALEWAQWQAGAKIIRTHEVRSLYKLKTLSGL